MASSDGAGMFTLARKLGIEPGQSLCLLDAPMASAMLVRSACPSGVAVSSALESAPYDHIFLWPVTLDGLAERLAALQRAIVPAGAVWTVIPNKRTASRRGITFTWQDVQAAALTTDLVDNKIVSLSNEEYGTRFVIRVERRNQYR